MYFGEFCNLNFVEYLCWMIGVLCRDPNMRSCVETIAYLVQISYEVLCREFSLLYRILCAR